MQSFIVLGIIPGTSLQTTFTFWIAVTLIIAAWPLEHRLWQKRHALRAYLIARKIARLINQSQFQLPA